MGGVFLSSDSSGPNGPARPKGPAGWIELHPVRIIPKVRMISRQEGKTGRQLTEAAPLFLCFFLISLLMTSDLGMLILKMRKNFNFFLINRRFRIWIRKVIA
jgi:hypothetical protein